MQEGEARTQGAPIARGIWARLSRGAPRDEALVTFQRRISTRPLSLKRLLRRVVVEPPARDVLAPHEPDARELESVLEEVAHGRRTRSLTAPARVHGNRHQARTLLAQQLVEPERQRVQVVARARETRAHEVAAVVVGLRVRHDEERTAEAL